MTLKACLQALFNAILRTRLKGKFVRLEAQVLDNLCLAFFEELTVSMEAAEDVGGKVVGVVWR